MANTLLTPDIIARLAYANLYEHTVMAQLVHRDYSADFNGKVGDTVTIRKPAVFEAKKFNRATGIEIQNATETGVPVQLDTLLDVSFEVTTEQWALEVVDFDAQLMQPALEAINQGIDREILTLRDDVTQKVTIADYAKPAGIREGRKILNKAKVPLSQRFAVWGPDTESELLGDALFHEADVRGDTEGLREGSIGRKFGFDHYMTQNIVDPTAPAAGDPTTETNLMFHQSAFALVSRTLPVPQGAARAAVFGANGFGVRVVIDYDVSKKQDVISIDTLIGVKTLDATRAAVAHGALQA